MPAFGHRRRFAANLFLSYPSCGKTDHAPRSKAGFPMSYAVVRNIPPQSPEADVRGEYGWLDVKSGLAKILQGYAVLIGGLSFCAFLVAASTVQLIKAGDGKLPLGALWFFYLGLGLTTLLGPLGYGMIAMGKFRCLMNAPERFHCRWLMFACMACLLMGPALNVTASFTGLSKAPELKRGPEGFRNVEFTKLGGAMQAVSGVIGLGSLVLFVLFLRAVARCFEDELQVALANLYLGITAFVAAGTLSLGFGAWHVLIKPPVLIGLATIWFLLFLGYLYLIMTTRGCIARGLAKLRTPLEGPPPAATTQTPAAPARAWPVV
jgi:hypothetical protein